MFYFYLFLRSTFFHFNLGLEGNAASIIDTNERGEVKIRLLAAPEVSFHYELSFFKSGNTSVKVPGEGKVSTSINKAEDPLQSFVSKYEHLA